MSDKQEVTKVEPAAQNVRTVVPRVDVFEEDAGITLLADLPGVAREQLNLRVEGESLTIEGDIATPMPEGMEAAYAEVHTPRYRRAFTLSRELDVEKIEANLKDGVLTLRIPKRESAQPRRIAVSVG